MALTNNSQPVSASNNLLNIGSSHELSKEDMVDILNEEPIEQPAPPKEKEEPVVEDKKEEQEEEQEEEIKLADENQEEIIDEDLILPFKRQEILKKYPEIFKDFPYLEKAYYRDQQFTEVISSPEEAKELIAKAQVLDKLESDVLKGSLEEVLKSVKENDSQAYGRLVDNYLTSLQKADPNAHLGLMGNIVKNTIQLMVQEAHHLQNEDLKNAALILNQFVFGTSQFQQPVKFSKNIDPEVTDAEKRIADREREFFTQRFNTVQEDLGTRVNNVLKSTIEQHIDPKQTMTDYTRKNAVRDALDKVATTLNEDTHFRRMLDNLWKDAAANNFSKSTTDKIRSAYLSKAKTILPDAIKKIRNEVLKNAGSSNRNSSDRKGPIPAGRSSASSNNSGKSKDEGKTVIPKGMSTYDYLMED
jgi:hypothetical protein